MFKGVTQRALLVLPILLPSLEDERRRREWLVLPVLRSCLTRVCV
jgi:hypothetical protein